MGGGSQRISNTAPVISSLRIQTSTFGRAIARVYGRTRVSGNLIWYGDFTPIAHTTVQSSGGKGGGGVTTENTTYTYTAAVLIALCSGTIGGVVNVWRAKVQDTLANLGLSLFTGTFAQNPFGYLTTNHPAEALSYRGLAYVASGAYDLGDNAELPNHSFEIDGLLPFSGSIKDSNPKDVIVDVLTEPFEGALFPSAKIGDLTQLSNYCVANGIFISPAYTEQKPAHEVIESLARIANAGVVFSEGLLKIRPYSDEAKTGNGATYTPDVTPVYALTDDDFNPSGDDDPVTVERSDPADAYNQVTLKFVNRANEYNDESVEGKDQADIDLYGLRPMDSAVEMREIADAAVARVVVEHIKQRSLFVRNKYRFSLPWNYVLLEPMDIVTLTEASGDGLVDVPVLICSIEENEDGAFDIEAEDFPAGVTSAVAYPMQQGGGYAADYNVPPGNVNTPVILDAPAVVTDSGFELWLAVSGSNVNWGGCQVWVATDSGGPYKNVGSVFGRTRHGTLSATLPVGADPDTVNTCSVDLTVSKGELEGGAQADADNLNTLSWIEGELISFQAATLTAANKYDLGTYLRRGVFNTVVSEHGAASRFARVDQALFRYPYDPELVGKTLYFKLLSFNVYIAALQQLADVSATAYAIGGPIGAPDEPTGFTVQQAGPVLNFHVDQVSYLKLDRVEIRFADPGESDWNNGLPVTNILRGNTDSNGSVPPGEWRFMARNFDRAGKPSKTWAVFDFAVSAEGFSTILSRDSAPNWANLQNQNLLTRSEELDDAAWTRTNIKAFGSGSVANSTAKPARDGFTTQEYLQADTTNGQHTLSRAAVLTAGAPQTISGHAGPGEYTKCWLGSGNGSANDRVLFDLVAGTIISQGSNVAAAGIGIADSYGNRRFWVALSSVPNTALYFGLVDAAGAVSFAGSGNDGLFAWGFQVNDGLVPLPYSKTISAAITTHDNFVVSVSGSLMPESTQVASGMADADLWDKYVSHPQAICTYTQPEIDKGIDAIARVYADIVSALGPGVTVGTASPKNRIDYRLAAGAYDGFEDWTIGTADFRFLKSQVRLDTAVGLVRITEFRTIFDAEPKERSGTYTTDGTGSVAVSFSPQFHIVPSLVVSPQGSGDVSASSTALTGAGFTGHFKTAGVAGAGTATYRASGP